MSDLLLLGLLLLAVSLGFICGRVHARRSLPVSDLPRESAQEMTLGLNYLLNEQTDAAIETFVQALQSHTESVEPAIALAKLYCRRGELDKAVLICQQQLARPSLSKEENAQVLQALGEAYLQSGLLDRAESLFLDVIRSGTAQENLARTKVLCVYEKEGAWDKAIEVALPLVRKQDEIGRSVSHYFLSRAEQCFDSSELRKGRVFLAQALKYDRNSVRARVLQMRFYGMAGKYKELLKSAEEILGFNGGEEILFGQAEDILKDCFLTKDLYLNWVIEVFKRSPSIIVLRVVLILLKENYSLNSALKFLEENAQDLQGLAVAELRGEVAGLLFERGSVFLSDYTKLVGLIKEEGETSYNVVYHCRKCGVQVPSFDWQCRHCGVWDSISVGKPE